MESKKSISPKRRGKSPKGKDDSDSFATRAALPAEFANVPELVLVKDQPSPNWSPYKEKMYEGALEHYEDEAILFMTNKFKEIEMPARPTQAQLDADSLLTQEYMCRYKLANDLIKDSTKRKKSLYGIVRKSIPKSIWNILIGTPKFHEEIDLEQDAERLWNLLAQRCGAGRIASKGVVEYNVNKEFYKMCQKDSQSIDDYYEAATNIITMFASAGMDAPDDEQQAITFMRGADTKRYGQAVFRLDNEVKFSRGAYPKTLSDMYMYLHEYTPEVNKPDPVQTAAMQTVYKAIAKEQKKKAKEQKSQRQQQKAESKQETSGKRGGKDGANKKSNATTTDKPTESQRAPPTPCRTCASLGFPGEMHWHSKCPRQDEAIAILTRHAAECSGVKSGTSA
eukprot:gene30486-34413_t